MAIFLKSLSLVFLSIIFFPIPLNAYDDYSKPDQIFEGYNNINSRFEVLIYFNGLVNGLTWSNSMSRSERNYETFCQPRDAIISAEQGYEIYKNHYLTNKSKWDSLSIEPTETIQPPAFVLLMGLREKYPC